MANFETIFIEMKEHRTWVNAVFKGGSSKTVKFQLPAKFHDAIIQYAQLQADKAEQETIMELLGEKGTDDE